MPLITTINPRVVTSLEGSLPVSFEGIADKLFYREIYDEHATRIWIPRSSMENPTSDLEQQECFRLLRQAFMDHPEFDSITLSNL